MTIQTFRSDGSLQFDTDIPPYVFTEKGTVTTISTTGANPHWSNTSPSTALIPMNYDSDEMIALYMPGYSYARYANLQFNGVWYHIFHTSAPVGTPVTFYRFVMGTNVATNYSGGWECFDGNGVRTFHAYMRPAVVAATLSGLGSSLTLPAGRSYASVVQTLAGHERYTYDNVVQSEQNEKGQTIFRWYDMFVDGKLYGVSWSGTTATLSTVSFNDQTAQYGIPTTGAVPPPPAPSEYFHIEIENVLFLDVTGL